MPVPVFPSGTEQPEDAPQYLLGGAVYVAPDDPATVSPVEETDYNTFAETVGLASTRELRDSGSVIEAMLENAGVNIDHPAVQAAIQGYGDMLQDPLFSAAMIANLREQFPAVPTQAYDMAFAESGFSGDFAPQLDPGGMAALTSGSDLQVARFRQGQPGFETQPDTGWIRYQNGVLVSPDGQVAFDPTSIAPGSERWKREVVSGWDAGKVEEWRKRLHDYGYLTKDQMKVEGVDGPFLNALSNYHYARYANGGKPVAGDLAGVAAGAEKPPLMDFDDMAVQVRNTVREEYRRVFGEDPTDGEVAAFSASILRTAEQLQKQYRRKDYGGYSKLAATNAEERFIERLEQSPEAQFLQDSEEENTRLRDAMQQAAVVTNSLGS